ncbi:MAG: hypothetical protein KFF73_07605 [Cyclobacteriaceae bacterium]|nr:hypothetical protein [Cyclobacteriaceae bacterium]
MKFLHYYLVVLLSIAGNNTILSAQSGKPVDVRIQLRDNQTVKGQLMITDLPVILSIYISEDDSMAVPTKIIRRITLENEEEMASQRIAFFNNTFIGIMSGRSSPQTSYRSQITAEMTNGIRFNTWCWTGLGLGFDQYAELSIMPLFFSFRGDMLKKPFTPFYFLDMGTGPSWIAENEFSDDSGSNAGLMYHFGGGLKIYADTDINVMIAIGFKSQEVEITRQLWGGQEEVTNRNYKNFSFRIGIGF